MKRFALLTTTALCLSLTGCASFTPAQNAAALRLAVATAQVVAASIDNGHLTVDYAQAIPVLVSSAATFLPSDQVSSSQVAAAVTKAVADGTGSGSTGTKIGAVIEDLLPTVLSGVQANQAISQAAAGASAGANPPKP